MTDNTIRTKIEVSSLDLGKKLEDIILSTQGFQLQESTENEHFELLILEVGEDIETQFRFIESLLNSDSVDEIFLTSENTDQPVLLRAMRTGVKEFFSLPIIEQEVRQALERFKKRQDKPNHQEVVKSGKIIDVFGSKGGVGATTIAVNLATAMVENANAKSVALVDLNTLFGEIPVFLSLKPNYHWGEITNNIDRLDATYLMNILSKHSSGIYILPSPRYLNGNRPATPEIMQHILGLMQTIFDYVIVDSGQSLNETSLRILEMSDNVLLISLLSLPCLSNTNNLLRSFVNVRSQEEEFIKIIINRYLKKSEISLKDAEDAVNRKIFWAVPNDYKTTMSAINQGKALCQFASNAPITKSLREMAGALIQKEEKERNNRWSFFKKNSNG
jgi:pilus assembly protein CpaE